MGEVFSSVHASAWVPDALGPDDEGALAALASLHAAAQAANRRRGVRSLLVCGRRFALQWLQGDEAAVRALTAAIAGDPRHAALQVLFEGVSGERLEAWATTLVSRSPADSAIDAVVQALRDGGLPPAGPDGGAAAILRRALEPPAQAGRQRVGVFGQNGVWPGALLAHLAGKWEAPLSRTVPMGSQGPEREAAIEHVAHDDPGHGPVEVVHYAADLLAAPWLPDGPAPLDVAAVVFSGTTEDGVVAFARQVLAQLAPGSAGARVVCLFGRTAARFLPQVQAVLDGSGHDARHAVVPLADGTAVWQEIARGLVARPVAPPAAAVAPAPPDPVPPPPAAGPAAAPAAAPVPSPMPPACIEHLLQVDGVAAVGWCAAGAAPVLRVHPAARAEALGHEFAAWCAAPRLAPDDGAHVVVRWAGRLTLLLPMEDPGTLLYLASLDGVTNERWLQLQVDAVLRPGGPA